MLTDRRPAGVGVVSLSAFRRQKCMCCIMSVVRSSEALSFIFGHGVICVTRECICRPHERLSVAFLLLG